MLQPYKLSKQVQEMAEPEIIAASVMGVLITIGLAGVGVLVFLGKISKDLGFAIFIATITIINFGLSNSIGSINKVESKRMAVTALISLNSIVIAILLFYLGITTYTDFQKTSVQNNYKYIHALIPVCVVVSVVSLSATAMKKLTQARCTGR